MIKFFHVADTHFGVENYGKIDHGTGMHSRFLDFVKSFERCVDQAVESKIDFFLFCGDAYKTAYPTPTQQKQFLRLLFKLQQAKIPVVSIVGNHDHPLSFGKTHALDIFNTVPLEGLHVFSKPGVIKLETKSGPVQVVGIPWPMRHNIMTKKEHRHKDPSEIAAYISEKVGVIIRDFASKLDSDIPAVLAGHLTVSSGVFSGSEKCAIFGSDPVLLPSQLAIEPFDYVALGHLHRHQNLNKDGRVPVVYSGSTERIDFGERREEKGFCSVVINSKKKWGERCSYEFVKIETRPMVQIEVALESGKNQTRQLVEAIEKHEIDGAIVKIVYHISGDSTDKVDLLAVQRACSLAMCVASITPVRKQASRERRVELNVAMDFMAVFEKYISSCDKDLGVNIDKLKEKASQMYNQLIHDNNDNNENIEGSGREKILFNKYADRKERGVRS